MARLLAFVIIALGIVLVLKGMARKQRLRERTRPSPAATAAGEDMVTCARCGVNLPRSDARAEGARLVCADNPRCREHA